MTQNPATSAHSNTEVSLSTTSASTASPSPVPESEGSLASGVGADADAGESGLAAGRDEPAVQPGPRVLTHPEPISAAARAYAGTHLTADLADRSMIFMHGD